MSNHAELGDRYVAVLDDRVKNGVLLRISVYPEHDLAYCGVWRRDDLLLGSSIVPVLAGTRGVYTTATVALDDGHCSVHFVAHWNKNESTSESDCVAAEARLVDVRNRTTVHLGLRSDADIASRLPVHHPRIVLP